MICFGRHTVRIRAANKRESKIKRARCWWGCAGDAAGPVDHGPLAPANFFSCATWIKDAITTITAATAATAATRKTRTSSCCREIRSCNFNLFLNTLIPKRNQSAEASEMSARWANNYSNMHMNCKPVYVWMHVCTCVYTNRRNIIRKPRRPKKSW